MDKSFIDNVVGKIIDYNNFWFSENKFTYEDEDVYLMFAKNESYFLKEQQQITYLYVITNLSKIVNKSLQTIKDLFYIEKLISVRFKCIFIESSNNFLVYGSFYEDDFDFSIQFNTNGEFVKFENDKLI